MSHLLPTSRKNSGTLTESPKETEHVKSINAETQTILPSTENKSELVNDSGDQKLKNKDSALKVFDDAPLNRIRKNRLAALMGNLAGKDAAILVKQTREVSIPNESNGFKNEESVESTKESETIIVPSTTTTIKENREEINLGNKDLISILSPNKTANELSPVRSDKHVHFIIPGTTSFSSKNEHFLLTQTSASIVTPIISASIGNSLVSSNSEKNMRSPCSATSVEFDINSLNTPSLTSYLLEDQSSSKNESLSTPSSMSHLFENVDSSKRALGKSNSSPSFSNFTSLQTSQQGLIVPTSKSPNIGSPHKLGGFRFDLKTPSTANIVSTAVGNSATYNPTFSNSPINTISTAISLGDPSSTTFTFLNPNDPKKNIISFGAASTNNSAISKLAFSFGSEVSKSQTLNISGEKLPLLNSAVSAGLSFGSNINSTLESSSYGSLTLNREPPHFNLSSNSPAATTTSAMLATTTVTYSSGFDSQLSSNFITNSTSTTPRSVFESSNTNAFLIPIATTSTPTSVTSTPIFGTTSDISKSVFGTDTPITSTSIFATTSTPTSGYGIVAVTSPSAFGNRNLLISSGFGIAAPTKTSSVFGTNISPFGLNLTTATATFDSNTTTSAFGSSNTTSAFGSSNTTSAFGSSNTTSGFGSSRLFDTTKTPVHTFGSNPTTGFENSSQSKPVLGSSTTTPKAFSAFGSNSFGSTTTDTSTTTTSPAFGANNPDLSFSFGSSKPKANVFGPVTTTNSNTFLSTSRFDPSSGFSNNTPAFGSPITSSSSFGITSTQAFGQVENKPTFAFRGSGENKPNSVFGSRPDNLAFGKPLHTQSGFGNLTGETGSMTTSGFSSPANGGFNFGSNAASSSQAPFAFGAPSGSAEPTKPTFNFTGGALSPPTFGSNSNTASFGSLNPNFGASTFGATGPSSSGVFNIGAGSNTGRPRTQLRAKRRT